MENTVKSSKLRAIARIWEGQLLHVHLSMVGAD